MIDRMTVDRNLAEAAKNRGMEQGAANARAKFAHAAYEAVTELAKQLSEFTANDVREYIYRRRPDLVTHDDRVLGSIMRKAAHAGIIQITDRMVKSGRLRNHNRRIQVWRSKLRQS